jgi:hypothetical protein
LVIRGPGLVGALDVAQGCTGHGKREGGIDFDRPPQAAKSFGETLFCVLMFKLQGAKIEIVGAQARLRLLLRSGDLCQAQCRHERAHHTLGNAVLEVEDIATVALEAISPDVQARGRVDELSGDTKAVAAAPDAALQHIAHPELAPDLTHIITLPL